MGNSVSGSRDRHSDESVDFGALVPFGVYTGSQDWNQQIVCHLIVDRKLSPFYRPLEEYEEDWDDDRILAARKEHSNAPPPPIPDPPPSASSTSSKFHRNLHKSGKEPFRPTEASIYRGAVECPICFLYYPPNINRSRCCDQAICTECFVQIKRTEPTATHLVSEPAACPYCVQENFGIVYEPPPWRTGLINDASRPQLQTLNSSSSGESNGSKRRRSFGADSPEVVTIDQIRPDWETKLAAVRAAVARRANRHFVMRQVGDRLIPIGITSGSGRVPGADRPLEGIGEGPEGGRRSNRRRNQGGQDLNQLLGTVGIGGLGGADLEELMVMEAMRLSLLEHEQQQRRQANGNNDSEGQTQTTSGNDDTPASSASPSPQPSSSPSHRVTLPGPHSPSPSPSPRETPFRQGPTRSRSPAVPSPLRNHGNSLAVSAALPVSAPPEITSSAPPGDNSAVVTNLQPPAIRTHRRTGSSPGPQHLSSVVAAALSAQQTATSFFNSSALENIGRHERFTSNVPRSAPATRAASPQPIVPEVRRREEPLVELNVSSSVPTAVGHIGHTHPPLASSSSNDAAPSSPPGIGTPSTENDERTSRDMEGYKTLASSIEGGDPLLHWNR